MISPTDEDVVRSILRTAAAPPAHGGVALPPVLARAHRIRRRRRALQAGAAAAVAVGVAAAVGPLRELLASTGGGSGSGVIVPAASGRAPGPVVEQVSRWGLAATIAVLLLAALGVGAAVRRLARWPLRRRADRGLGPSRRVSALAWSGAGAAAAVVLLGLSTLVRAFLVQAYVVPSVSMAPTLSIGDVMVVSGTGHDVTALHRGDVVVFRDPGGWLPPRPSPDGGARSALAGSLRFLGLLPQDGDGLLVKRVVGLPGDTVMCCDPRGRVTVNGVAVDETYLRGGPPASRITFTVTVAAGYLWVLGDNRDESADSRLHRNLPGEGGVPLDRVVGRVRAVVWPLTRFGGTVQPPDVFARVPAAARSS